MNAVRIAPRKREREREIRLKKHCVLGMIRVSSMGGGSTSLILDSSEINQLGRCFFWGVKCF